MSPEPREVRSQGFLRRHVGIILFAVLVTVFASLGVVALRPATYASTAVVVVKPQIINGVPMEPQMGTEAATVRSGYVLRRAAQLLNGPEDQVRRGLSVSVPVDTTVVEIQYEASTPMAAFEGADAFTRAYVDYRNSGSDARVAEVITPAGIPREESQSNYPVVIALAVLGGLLLGIAAGVLRERALQGGPATGGAPMADSAPADDVARPTEPETPVSTWQSSSLSRGVTGRRGRRPGLPDVRGER